MCSKQDLKVVVPKQHPNPRVHNLLFKNNSPFKPKVVQSKLLYKRNEKHPKSYNPFG